MTKQAAQTTNGLPLAPVGERTTIANFMARRRPCPPLQPSKIGKLLESKVHNGRH